MSALESILGMLPDRVSSGKQDHIFTPPHIAKEMIEALPEDTWNRYTTFFDPICKSGIFLYEIYQKLMESADLIEGFPDKQDRREYIINNQLFGIAVDKMCQLISIRNVYGYLEPDSHIILLNEYQTVMRNSDKRFLIETLKKEFGTMKFDVVIGNPPYNKGMDLDFVDLGYKLSNKYTCMITPAKWQMGSTDKSLASKSINYEQFRQQLVPYMNYVCFYPNALDVFDIRGNTGITYFIMDKHMHSECTIENKFRCFPEYYNSVENRDITNGSTLCNVGNQIVSYIPKTAFNYIRKKSSDKKWIVWGTTAMPMFLDFKPNSKEQHYMTSDLKLELSNALELSSDSFIFFESDSKRECESFISYLYTKIVRFLISCAIGSYKAWNKSETFRFVPAPPSGKFDHIYTDEELYKAFNLPQKYIDVIYYVQN